jgi:hypothetical protein
MLTQALADALAEAEKIVIGAPHVATEQDVAEGYEYLAGSIQASMRLAWAYQRDFPYFVQSTGPWLPYYETARVSVQEWRTRIAARQAAVAERMLG